MAPLNKWGCSITTIGFMPMTVVNRFLQLSGTHDYCVLHVYQKSIHNTVLLCKVNIQ